MKEFAKEYTSIDARLRGLDPIEDRSTVRQLIAAKGEILKAWREGRIRLLISDEIFDEYQRDGELLSNDFPKVDLGPFLELLAINA